VNTHFGGDSPSMNPKIVGFGHRLGR
jgi:hypothetical protein